MSTLDVAGNSNREVPSFLHQAIKAIDESSWRKQNGKFCLTCSLSTRKLTDEEICLLVDYYRFNCGFKNTRIETTPYKKYIIIE